MAIRKGQIGEGYAPARRLCAVVAWGAVLACLLISGPAAAQDQPGEFVEEDLGDVAAPGEEAEAIAAPLDTGPIFRLTFFGLDQLAYVRHPFLQITGDSDFQQGRAANSLFSISTPKTDEDQDFLVKALHSLPSFGIESVRNVDLIVPRAFGIGFDYVRFSQTDKEALNTEKSTVVIPRISMDSRYYSVYAKAYAFPVTEPGLNYFIGVGTGFLDGKFLAIPFEGAQKRVVGFRQAPYGFTQLGLEILGEDFGFRYEIRVISADRVRLDDNPYLGQSNVTKIDFSGSMIRLSLFIRL